MFATGFFLFIAGWCVVPFTDTDTDRIDWRDLTAVAFLLSGFGFMLASLAIWLWRVMP